MEYQLLGKSELSISRIGFGCMSLDPYDPESEKILHEAVDKGINYFDTADLYHKGENESLLGRSFYGRRNGVIISTKAGNQWRPDGTGWQWNASVKYLLECIEQSLRRLKTDYIDLFQLHGGTMEDPIDEIIEAFEKLKTSGRIRHYGISSIRPAVIREWVKKSRMVSVMMQYSLLDRRPEEEVFPLLKKNQIGVLARGVLAKGILVSKPAEPFLNYPVEKVEQIQQQLKDISILPYGPADRAIHFAIDNTAVSAAVIGIRTKEQLRTAIDAGRTAGLSLLQSTALRNTLSPNTYTDYR